MGLENLENLIEIRRKECTEAIKKNHPELIDDGEININKVEFGTKNKSSIIKEFLVWDNLLDKYYWRSLPYINELSKLEDNPLSEKDMRSITQIMIEQITKGEKVAAGIPLYSDVWDLVGKKGSPLEEYVTEEHKRNAVNIGFWNTLKQTSDPLKVDSSSRELSRILNYENFFEYFDLKKGAKKAAELPTKINLESTEFGDWDLYMRWFLVQEVEIFRNLEKEKRNETRGKLIAPLVRYLLVGSGSSLEGEIQLKRLANFFINGDIIKSQAIQDVLGEVFERELENGFEGYSDYYDFSASNLEMCEGTLINLEKHVDNVWRKVKDDIDLSRIHEEVKKYVPRQAYEDYAQKLREEIEKISRINSKALEKLRILKDESNITKSLYGRIRNHVLDVYFSQKQRPSGNDLIGLKLYTQRENISGYLPDKINAYLYADFLKRKRWRGANEILIDYDDLTYAHWKKFTESLHKYVQEHGTIPLDTNGLKVKSCYPGYNKIPDFKEMYNKLFRVKK